MYPEILMRINDCYRMLNVPQGADRDEVKKAYRTLARRYHPDLNSGNPAHEARFKQISQAYNKLEHHYKTRNLRRVISHNLPPPAGENQNNSKSTALQKAVKKFTSVKTRQRLQQWVEWIKQTLFEYEKKIFPLNIEKAITLNAAMAATGSTVKVRTASESFQVKIPATTQNQIELLLPEKGGKSFIKGKRGDLLLKIRVVPEGVISPGTTNFFYKMEVPKDNIGNGRVLTLNTIQGQIKFFVPKGTLDGQTFVLKTKPHDTSILRINHVLTLNVV